MEEVVREMNLDEMIILYVHDLHSTSDLVITGANIMQEFSTHGKGYVLDRIQVLVLDGYLIKPSNIFDYYNITYKGIDWAIELREKTEPHQKKLGDLGEARDSHIFKEGDSGAALIHKDKVIGMLIGGSDQKKLGEKGGKNNGTESVSN